MFKNRLISAGAIIGILFFLSGCGEYEKLLKSRDFQAKYDAGVEYYEEEEFARAGTLFDQVANVFRGTTKADTVKYYQAKSYYGQRDYMMAGYYFSELASTYVSSVFVEEADFMTGYCFYKRSPRAELDQATTYQAITTCRCFCLNIPLQKELLRRRIL